MDDEPLNDDTDDEALAYDDADLRPYDDLGPDRVLAAVESLGFVTDGRQLALNSYENRVYQVGIEGEAPLIAKFYRPGRWSDAAIEEEHAFARELSEAEIPMIAPLDLDGDTLFHHAGYRFSLSERCGGRAVELDQDGVLSWLGRFLGRLHQTARSGRFQHRPELTIQRYGWDSREELLEQGWLPEHLETPFDGVSQAALELIEQAYESVSGGIRLHGDFHAGNILWRDGPFFVDLDDCLTGPPIQDVWLLLSGDREQMQSQLNDIVDGYEMFAQPDQLDCRLIEPLRTLRYLHHAAWLARRWDDPAFPMAFPWFDSNRYWEDLVLSLREQIAAMQEPPLVI